MSSASGCKTDHTPAFVDRSMMLILHVINPLVAFKMQI